MPLEGFVNSTVEEVLQEGHYHAKEGHLSGLA